MEKRTFALPDLRGRMAIGQGSGPGLAPYVMGQLGGVEQVTLTLSQLPVHSHAAMASSATTHRARARPIGVGDNDHVLVQLHGHRAGADE